MPSLGLLAVAFAVFALAVIPTRRLAQAGWRPGALLLYLLALIGLALAAIEFRGPLRLLIPAVVLLYLLPFAVPPDLLARLARRRAGGPPGPAAPRNVTPPDIQARVIDPERLGPGASPTASRGPTPGRDPDAEESADDPNG